MLLCCSFQLHDFVWLHSVKKHLRMFYHVVFLVSPSFFKVVPLSFSIHLPFFYGPSSMMSPRCPGTTFVQCHESTAALNWPQPPSHLATSIGGFRSPRCVWDSCPQAFHRSFAQTLHLELLRWIRMPCDCGSPSFFVRILVPKMQHILWW